MRDLPVAPVRIAAGLPSSHAPSPSDFTMSSEQRARHVHIADRHVALAQLPPFAFCCTCPDMFPSKSSTSAPQLQAAKSRGHCASEYDTALLLSLRTPVEASRGIRRMVYVRFGSSAVPWPAASCSSYHSSVQLEGKRPRLCPENVLLARRTPLAVHNYAHATL